MSSNDGAGCGCLGLVLLGILLIGFRVVPFPVILTIILVGLVFLIFFSSKNNVSDEGALPRSSEKNNEKRRKYFNKIRGK